MSHLVKILGQYDSTLTLDTALLLYKSNAGDVYATAHPVDIDPNEPHRKVIGAGTPLTKAALATFAAAVSTSTAYAGFIPQNLVYTSPNILAWWTPAAIRTAWFRSTEPMIGEQHGPVAHPAMIFVVTPGDWFVYAMHDDVRPDASTPLFHSPHMNVWDHGRICTGNVKLPPAPTSDAISEFERCFFQSRFTHPNRQGAVRYKGGMNALWRDQLKKPDMASMQKALTPAKQNLGAAIEHIIATHRLPAN